MTNNFIPRKHQLSNWLISKLANWQIRNYSNWIILLLSLIFLLSENSFAQEVRWQNTIGGSAMDLMTSVKQTSDGGFILGGWSMSGISGDKSESSQGGSDFWIVKTDGIGNILWQNTIGGIQDERLNSIVLTNDGGILLGGSSNSGVSGDKTEPCLGANDFWLVKVDSLGVIEWQNVIGGSGEDVLVSMQMTTDGGFILGGSSNSGVSGDKTEPGLGGKDCWIVKIDSVGNILWQNTIGGSGNDRVNSIQQTADGGYILGCVSNSNISGDKTEDAWASTDDFWLIKTNANGSLEWQNTIGGVNYDELTYIQQTIDGGYILGGRSRSGANGNKNETHYGDTDYWIIKTNHHGYIQWQNTIGGHGQDDLRSLHPTADGGYLVVGNSYSNTSVDKAEDNRGWYWSDLWILKIDSIGNILWQNSIGGKKNDVIYASTLDSEGNLVLGGTSESMKTGDKSENSMGGYDFWLIKLTDQFNEITGKIFLDLNSNLIQDNNEPSLINRKILQNTSRFAFSNATGRYRVAVPDTGYFKVYGPTVNGYLTMPSFHSANFSGFSEVDSLNDFAIQPNGSIQDFKLTLTAAPDFRTWMTVDYYLSYGNLGNNSDSADIVFYPDLDLDIISIYPPPTFVSPDSIVWSNVVLMPFMQNQATIVVQPKAGTIMGTPIISMARMGPGLNDVTPNDNIVWDSSEVVASADPNSIEVDKFQITDVQIADSVYLEYLIQFQNVGTDTAFNVQIINRINRTQLEPSSFEFIASSHPVEMEWINYKEEMVFRFNNIMLPDSVVNEPFSHGFVRYRLRPDSGLVPGDTIYNNAAIYFDFNAPVITNTAITIVPLPVALESVSPASILLNIFPNPAKDKINITNLRLENGKANLRLTDLYGKLLLEKNLTTSNTEISIDHLPSGVYFLLSGEMRATFVKQ